MIRKQNEKGFSLIELLIVVAIILIIAAIAIPNLLRARMVANEASAVGSVRTISTSAVMYSSTWGVPYQHRWQRWAVQRAAWQVARQLS
jgi:prepilin-type N-terminal cleavage/methylation domain-containing protein